MSSGLFAGEADDLPEHGIGLDVVGTATFGADAFGFEGGEVVDAVGAEPAPGIAPGAPDVAAGEVEVGKDDERGREAEGHGGVAGGAALLPAERLSEERDGDGKDDAEGRQGEGADGGPRPSGRANGD